MQPIRFVLNQQPVEIVGLAPTTTLLEYLRNHRTETGTKEGCAEGDCGACTVALLNTDAQGQPTWRAVNACLILLPMLHGKEIKTVEGLGGRHPIQTALVEELGSQCGYCTPGVVMTMFEACYRNDLDAPWKLDDQMCGTLCRCTGYRPIKDATLQIAGLRPGGPSLASLSQPASPADSLTYGSDAHTFVYPTSVDELFDAIEAHPTHRFVCGATDLGLEVTKHHQTWPCLISLDGISSLKNITATDAGLDVGASVVLSNLESACDADWPALARMLRFFGSRQIKNLATVGGNLCNASPIGDLAPILLALDARLTLASRGGERTVPIDAFFLSYRKTALNPGEILSSIHIPRHSPSARIGAYKVSKRRELDISAVAAGMFVQLDDGLVVTDVRLGWGGMAATPARARQTEDLLRGQVWCEELIERGMAQLQAEFTPLSDHRGTDWYRTTVAANLLRGFFLETRTHPQPRLPDRPSGTVVLESS